MEECKEALKTFKDNKSPGGDGLTKEFYKHFWQLLAPHLLNFFREIFSCLLHIYLTVLVKFSVACSTFT